LFSQSYFQLSNKITLKSSIAILYSQRVINHRKIIKDIKSSSVTNNRFKMHRTHHVELRLLLTCFYIHLICHTFLYIKQVFFHNSLLSSPFRHPYAYVHIRAIVGSCVSLLYRFLLLYALWRRMAALLLISIIFLATLTTMRLFLDFYGYFSGYIEQSLYYPFEPFDKKLMIEEIIDLVFALIQDGIGLGFSFYIFTDIVNHNKSRRSMRQLNYRSSISI
jgi:hypothetical protein